MDVDRLRYQGAATVSDESPTFAFALDFVDLDTTLTLATDKDYKIVIGDDSDDIPPIYIRGKHWVALTASVAPNDATKATSIAVERNGAVYYFGRTATNTPLIARSVAKPAGDRVRQWEAEEGVNVSAPISGKGTEADALTIEDGAIAEAKLATAVQTKLNARVPTRTDVKNFARADMPNVLVTDADLAHNQRIASMTGHAGEFLQAGPQEGETQWATPDSSEDQQQVDDWVGALIRSADPDVITVNYDSAGTPRSLTLAAPAKVSDEIVRGFGGGGWSRLGVSDPDIEFTAWRNTPYTSVQAPSQTYYNDRNQGPRLTPGYMIVRAEREVEDEGLYSMAFRWTRTRSSPSTTPGRCRRRSGRLPSPSYCAPRGTCTGSLRQWTSLRGQTFA